MRKRLTLMLLCFIVAISFYYIRPQPKAINAFNHTNLMPYQAVMVSRLEPKV